MLDPYQNEASSPSLPVYWRWPADGQWRRARRWCAISGSNNDVSPLRPRAVAGLHLGLQALLPEFTFPGARRAAVSERVLGPGMTSPVSGVKRNNRRPALVGVSSGRSPRRAGLPPVPCGGAGAGLTGLPLPHLDADARVALSDLDQRGPPCRYSWSNETMPSNSEPSLDIADGIKPAQRRRGVSAGCIRFCPPTAARLTA